MSRTVSAGDKIYERLNESRGVSVEKFLNDYDELETALYCADNRFKPKDLKEYLEEVDNRQTSRYLAEFHEAGIIDTWGDTSSFNDAVIQKDNTNWDQFFEAVRRIRERYNES